MFLFHRLSLSQELKKAPTPPAQLPPPPVTPAPPQPQVVAQPWACVCVAWPCIICFLSPADAQKRKSKWDSAIPVTLAQPTIITTTATLPAVVSVTTTAAGTKTTVISAVGTILKKAKQWAGRWWVWRLEEDLHHFYICERILRRVKWADGQFKSHPEVPSRPDQTSLD